MTSAPQPEVAAQTEPVSPRPQPAVAYVPAPSHTFGIGVLTSGPGMGIGGTARAWAGGRLGVQLDVVRTAMRNDLFGSSLTSTQVGPRVLMALRDRVSDSLWVRPYVGAGARFYRSSVSGLGVGVPTTDNRIGAQMFGGVELSAAGAPRFGLSVDVGYDWLQNPFDQYTLNGVAVAVSGRWYVR